MDFEKLIVRKRNCTIYRDGDKAIKVFDKDFNKAEIFNEATIQVLMDVKGIRVPKIMEIKEIEGQWAIVSEFIEGKTLAKWMEEEPEKKEEYIKLMVELQSNINNMIDYSLIRISEKLSRTICGSNLLATTRYGMHSKLLSAKKENNVLHGKFYPTNIIIQEDGTPCVLDWTFATIGNKEADVAITYVQFLLHLDPEGAEMYLDTYCEVCGLDKESVKEWIPIVAAAHIAGSSDERYEILYPIVYK